MSLAMRPNKLNTEIGYANMWAAVFADVGVSIIAILNAIRAMRVKLPDMPAGSTNQG